MKNDYAIKVIHHNRCVVIPAEQLVQAGISKGDYVVVRVFGDRLCIEKARLVLDEPAANDKLDGVLSQIPNMTAAQLGEVGRACANQFEALELSRR